MHRRKNAKKQTRLNFTKDTEMDKQEQGIVINISASEVTKKVDIRLSWPSMKRKQFHGPLRQLPEIWEEN